MNVTSLGCSCAFHLRLRNSLPLQITLRLLLYFHFGHFTPLVMKERNSSRVIFKYKTLVVPHLIE